MKVLFCAVVSTSSKAVILMSFKKNNVRTYHYNILNALERISERRKTAMLAKMTKMTMISDIKENKIMSGGRDSLGSGGGLIWDSQN